MRLPASAIIGGPGQAFAIAQARLGPGRIHHCMRLIGLAELALELACVRAGERVAFGKPIANLGGNRERIADARIAIDQARLRVLHAAWLMDTQSPGRARRGLADQGRRAEHGPARRRHGDPAARRRRPLRRLAARAPPGRSPARCAWPTGPTRSTAASSPAWSSRATASGAGPPNPAALGLHRIDGVAHTDSRTRRGTTLLTITATIVTRYSCPNSASSTEVIRAAAATGAMSP